jgi:hypothetical protein
MSDTAALPELQREPARRRNRGLIAVVASVVAVVLIAGGGFAAWKFFFGGGPRPAEVLPASTFALVTVDLNPSGGQKVEAIKTLRKFPSWNKRTGVTPDSDVLKAIFDEAFKDGPCKSLDYERDVKPWIGSRAALGGVVLDKKPRPVLALQIKDADKARTAFPKLATCSDLDDGEGFGWTISDGYILASDSDAHAKSIAASGKKSPLAENGDFQKWTEEAGGAGIVNAYMGSNSTKVIADNLGRNDVMAGGLTSGSEDSAKDELNKAFKDFEGAAGVLRFADGGIELAFAGGGTRQLDGAKVGDHVTSLPKDTAAVLALSMPEEATDQLKSSEHKEAMDLLNGILGETGLDLPDDLITLLGSSLSISLGGDAPADLKDISGPADIPAGLLVHGDDQKIKAIIEKVEARTGAQLSELPATVSTKDGMVAVSTKPDYADQLLEKGSLGDAKDFKDVVSHANDAQGVFYLSLDNDWAEALKDLAADENDKDAQEVADNLATLRAMGASAWSEGDTSHGLVRIALE